MIHRHKILKILWEDHGIEGLLEQSHMLVTFQFYFQTGKCKNRPKRGIIPEDDTVDDQDTIPSFNPTVTTVNFTLSWPTPSGITKENVTQFCEKKLRFSKAGAACGQLGGVDVDGLVEQCITDIQVG